MRIDEVAPSKINVNKVVTDFGKFFDLCKKMLKLEKLPKIEWIIDGSHHKKFNSFGSFHNKNQTIYVELANRHPIDVMRTIAHELVHYKQYLENRMKPNSGETGSEIENEANATAAIIMRNFDNKYPDAFEVQALSESEAWQKAAGKNPEGGLNKKGVASYRRSHPGSKLQTAVTTKPSKLKKGSKASKRRKSFCARMKGMKKSRTGAKTARDPDSRINKSLRKWNCESIEEMKELVMIAEAYLEEKAKQRLDPKCWTGYRKAGTKMKGGIRVNNCVKTEGRTGLGGVSTATSRAHQASRFGHDPDRAAPVYRPNKDGYVAPRNGTGDESNIILQLKKNLDRAVGKPLSFQDGSILEIRPTIARYALGIIDNMRPVERHETIKNIMQSKDAFIGFIKSQNKNVDEAANPAQQAAIAIAKKKDKGVDENFADGKGPGRPGDSARHGIPKHATMSELEKASHAKGRKGQLARWQMNMRNGKKK